MKLFIIKTIIFLLFNSCYETNNEKSLDKINNQIKQDLKFNVNDPCNFLLQQENDYIDYINRKGIYEFEYISDDDIRNKSIGEVVNSVKNKFEIISAYAIVNENNQNKIAGSSFVFYINKDTLLSLLFCVKGFQEISTYSKGNTTNNYIDTNVIKHNIDSVKRASNYRLFQFIIDPFKNFGSMKIEDTSHSEIYRKYIILREKQNNAIK
jgi:hypothetical protein